MSSQVAVCIPTEHALAWLHNATTPARAFRNAGLSVRLRVDVESPNSTRFAIKLCVEASHRILGCHKTLHGFDRFERAKMGSGTGREIRYVFDRRRFLQHFNDALMEPENNGRKNA